MCASAPSKALPVRRRDVIDCTEMWGLQQAVAATARPPL
jgi:hypothetical protein